MYRLMSEPCESLRKGVGVKSSQGLVSETGDILSDERGALVELMLHGLFASARSGSR